MLPFCFAVGLKIWIKVLCDTGACTYGITELYEIIRDFGLPPRCWWHLRSSGILHASCGNPLPTFPDNVSVPYSRSWPPEDGAERLSRNVGKGFPLTGMYEVTLPIPVAGRSKAWVCGRSLAEITVSYLARGMNVCLLWVLCVVS
jgi:hypothetical protein